MLLRVRYCEIEFRYNYFTMRKKFGVSLSGGGYRAAAFHLGVLKKLKELDLLARVDVISTISGGSIIGAYYALHSNDFEKFESGLRVKLMQSIVKKILLSPTILRIAFIALIILVLIVYLLFTCYAWLSLVILILSLYLTIKYQFTIFPVSKIIEKAYDELFCDYKKLSDLPEEKPLLVINATNLQTSRQFNFSRIKMGDSKYGKDAEFYHEKFPVARAVMASSAVPLAFTPVPIGKEFYKELSILKYVNPLLVDGGVYDNQGAHRLTEPSTSNYTNIYECETIIVSDAGNKIKLEGVYDNNLSLIMRTMNVFMNRIKMFQIQKNIYLNTLVGKREIAYLSLGWDLKSCIKGFVDNFREGNVIDKVIEAHRINKDMLDDEIKKKLEENVRYSELLKSNVTAEELELARNVSTNLTGLTKAEIDALGKHAAVMTELQVRLYCPELLLG